MLRLNLFFILILAAAGCADNPAQVGSAVNSFPIVDPLDPESIKRWEESEYNYGESKIVVVELYYFGNRFDGLPASDATALALEVFGAKKSGVSTEQKSAIELLKKNEKEIHAAVRAAVYKYYKQSYPAYKEGWSTAQAMFGGGDFSDVLPVIANGDELDELVQLSAIYIHPAANGVAPVGFVFTIPWDGENELGVLLLGETVKAIGNSYEAMPAFK